MVSLIRPELCVRCKGRLWCGLSRCPILEVRKRVVGLSLKEEMAGYSPPSLLVGWRGYPEVSLMPLLTRADPTVSDNPVLWMERRLGIDEILDIRMRMGGGTKRIRVDGGGAVVDTVRELAMSREPVALDITFHGVPRPVVSYSSVAPPVGFRGRLKSLEVAENPRVDRDVEKIYYDELKAKDAIIGLYEKGKDVYEISRYLSGGLLGKKKRFVPTRWAITAVDSILSEHLLREVVHFPTLDRVLLFHSNLLDNHFYVVFMPGPWAFELVEAWAPLSFWTRGKRLILSDYEVGRGRKTYPGNVGGSYYAARLAVLEKLRSMERVASVVVLREVREGYYAPLGVWQVRENVRAALRGKPFEFSSVSEALLFARDFLGTRIDPHEWKGRSKLLGARQSVLWGSGP